MAFSKAGAVGLRRLDALVRAAGLEVSSVEAIHADAAIDAYRAYGRGSGHPAKLNFGDCFAYALASVSDDTLLFVGDDFGHTDLVPAIDNPPSAPR